MTRDEQDGPIIDAPNEDYFESSDSLLNGAEISSESENKESNEDAPPNLASIRSAGF